MRNDLIFAAKNGDKDKVKLILSKGTNINLKDKKGYTALHWCCYYGYTYLIDFLISEGADVECRTYNGSTPLHKAATNGHLPVINILLERGANLEARTANENNLSFSGRTALHEAAVEGEIEAVKLLLKRGASRASINDAGETPLDLGVRYIKDRNTIESLKVLFDGAT